MNLTHLGQINRGSQWRAAADTVRGMLRSSWRWLLQTAVSTARRGRELTAAYYPRLCAAGVESATRLGHMARYAEQKTVSTVRRSRALAVDYYPRLRAAGVESATRLGHMVRYAGLKSRDAAVASYPHLKEALGLAALGFARSILMILAAGRVVLRNLYHPYLALALTLVAVEAALGLRLWTQLSSRPLQDGTWTPVLDLSNHLVEPFRNYDTAPQIKETGVFDFATVLAMNVYLAIGLAGILLGLVATAMFKTTLAMVRFARNHP